MWIANSVLHELKLDRFEPALALSIAIQVETKCRHWVLSSAVEQRPYKAKVVGSTPTGPTISKNTECNRFALLSVNVQSVL